MEERGASEVSKIKFLKTKGIKIQTQNSDSWVKTIHVFSFNFLTIFLFDKSTVTQNYDL